MAVGIECPAVGGQPLECLKALVGEARPRPVALVGDRDQTAVEHALDGGSELRSALVRSRCPALDVEALGDAGGLPEPGHELAANYFAFGAGQLEVVGHFRSGGGVSVRL